MARGSSEAKGAATAAQGISNQSNANAQGLFSTLAPQLESEAMNPTGLTPDQVAKMDTAAQQSAGGANAGAVGQGALQTARTRNAGGADAAIEKSARSASQTLSRGVLGTRIQDAEMKNANRRAAIGGMEGLYGTNAGTSVGALGQVASNVNADVNAQNASWNWAKYILDPMIQASGAMGAAKLGA